MSALKENLNRREKMKTEVINEVAAETSRIAGSDSRTQKTMATMILRDRGYEGGYLTQMVGRVLDVLAS